MEDLEKKDIAPEVTNVLSGKAGDDNIRSEFTQFYKNIFVPNTENADCGYHNKVDAAVNARNNICNRLMYTVRVARCPVFDQTVRFFCHPSSQKYDAKPDN